MPGEWQYHADGVSTAVTTNHDLDGTLSTVKCELDSFRLREWTEEELEEHTHPPDTHFHEKEDIYEEYKDGSHATVVFDVNDGIAKLRSITPEDIEAIRVRHMKILQAAERVVSQLEDVDEVRSTIEELATAYHEAEEIHIDVLDS